MLLWISKKSVLRWVELVRWLNLYDGDFVKWYAADQSGLWIYDFTVPVPYIYIGEIYKYFQLTLISFVSSNKIEHMLRYHAIEIKFIMIATEK